MTDDRAQRLERIEKLFSTLTDKTGSSTRMEIVFKILDDYPDLQVGIEYLALSMGKTRQQIFPHLRRLYEADLITNPTRKKYISPTQKLLAVAEGLQTTFERI